MQISFTVIAKLISAFVFPTWIVKYLYFLNPKFQVSSHLHLLYSLVFVRPGHNLQPWFSHVVAHFKHEAISCSRHNNLSVCLIWSKTLIFLNCGSNLEIPTVGSGVCVEISRFGGRTLVLFSSSRTSVFCFKV